MPWNWSGVRSPRVIFTCTVLKPCCFCAFTFVAANCVNAAASSPGCA